MVIKVAVIGCGAAGLCALRHLTDRPEVFEAMGFEQQSQPGGTWIYTDAVGIDTNGLPVQSSMYKNLRTNLPKEVMAFPDFPFPRDLPSYIKHEDVLAYLHAYCSHFQLYQHIKFETKVDLVQPLKTEPRVKWKVSYSSVSDPDEKGSIEFDAVMVCNGHYAIPLVPTIPGMENFQGTITHSHDYRVPDPYRNKTVVCLGASSSGQDIALDLATTARKVIISHNKPPLQTILPENITQQPGIARLGHNSVVFYNGDEETIDTLLLCTGYKYSFPFLHQSCHPAIKDERIIPLYKHLIHSDFPTLSFVGICKVICPFPQFNCQIQFVLATLDGRHALPSLEEMKNDTKEEFETRLEEGLPPRYAHFMVERQWAYNDELAKWGGFKSVPRVVEILFKEAVSKRLLDVDGYKNRNYLLVDGEHFVEL